MSTAPETPSPIRYVFNRRSAHSPIPPEQWAAFLDELRSGPNGAAGNQVIAARAVGISFSAVAYRRRNDPDFNFEVELALEQSGHILLEAAWNRAIEKSDPLMLRLLEAYLPQTFSRDRKVDIQVTHRTPITLTAEERAALEPIKRRLLLTGAPGYDPDDDPDPTDVEWTSVDRAPDGADPAPALPQPPPDSPGA